MITPEALVLVVVLNNRRDLEIARLLGWYRIPLRHAPKVVSVDYLAFYQTAAFGDEGWQIELVAPVRGHELVTRAELLRDQPDHPRAREEYYKIQIGPLESLSHALRAVSWKRITFFYTTGEYLLQAETVNDLVVRSEERKSLWQALRERASTGQQYRTEDEAELDLDAQTLAYLLGIKELDEPYSAQGDES